MTPWLILNIPETADKDAVKRAYMTLLPKYNPEDDPEGFQLLRAAYEQALKEIDGKAETDDSPKGIFMQKVKALYDNFMRRREPAQWKELFRDDICQRLDMEDDITNGVLAFLMDNNFLPAAVFGEIVKTFDIKGKEDALKKIFPPAYIDYVIRNTEYEPIDYALFDAASAKNADRALNLFFEAGRYFADSNTEAAEKAFDEIAALGVSHPQFDLQKAKILAYKGETDRALELAAPVYEKYPDDYNNCLPYAYVLRMTKQRGHIEEALRIYREQNAKHPDYYPPLEGMCECLLELGQTEEARNIARDALEAFPSSTYLLAANARANTALAEEYEKKYAEMPNDFETAITLCKHYLNTDRFAECDAILRKFKDHADDERYCDYKADILLHNRKFKEASEYLQKSIALKKDFRKCCTLAGLLTEAGRYNEAIALADEYLSAEQDENVSPTQKATLHLIKASALGKAKRYEEAVAAADEGINIKQDMFYLYSAKAGWLKELGRYAEALDCCETAIYHMPYDLTAYTLEMEIYTSANRPDDAIAVYERAEALAGAHPLLLCRKAEALIKQKKEKEPVDILTGLMRDKDTDDFIKAECQISMGEVFLNKLDYDKSHSDKERAETLDTARELIEKGIKRGVTTLRAYDLMVDCLIRQDNFAEALKWQKKELKEYDTPNNRSCEAWLYRWLGRYDDALKSLRKAVRIYPGNEYLRRRLAEYYHQLKNDYKKAIKIYKEITDNDPDRPDIWDDIAYCLGEMGRYKEAFAILNRFIEQYPDNVWLRARRGFMYYDVFKPQEAIDDLLIAITDTAKLESDWNVSYVYNRIAHIYDDMQNNAEEAEKYYNMTLAREKDAHQHAYANLCLGDIYFSYYRDYEKALDYYNKKITLDPDSATGYKVRAELYRETGEIKKSRADFKRALALYTKEYENDTEDTCAICHIGECLLGLGKFKKAIEYLNAALASDRATCPQRVCHEAYSAFATYYSAYKGDYDKALFYIEKALELGNSVNNNALKAEILRLRQNAAV